MTTSQSTNTLTSALITAFTISYYILLSLLAICTLCFELALGHMILYRLAYGQFPTYGSRGRESQTSDTQTSAEPRVVDTTRKEAQAGDITLTGVLTLFHILLAAFVPVGIMVARANARDKARGGRVVFEPGLMGGDLGFGALTVGIVLMILITVEAGCVWSWSIFAAWAERDQERTEREEKEKKRVD